MDRIHILHVIETRGPGGAERMMVQLAGGLGSQYHSEAALIRDGWLGAALRNRGIPVTMLHHKSHGSFRNLCDFATLCHLVRLIREKRVALLHTHEFFMNTLGMIASRLTGIPLVATVHERNYYPDRFRRRLAYRLVGRFAGQMVTVSEDLKGFVTERIGIPSSRLRVVPNGVNVSSKPSCERVSTLRKNLGIEQYKYVVGTVGRLHPKKGHKYLIEGALYVVRRCPDVVFLIVGSGRVREDLEKLARTLGIDSNMLFLGHREDVSDLLGACDVFALPSLSEGMPLALLEAMATGLPSVATCIAGVREVVENGESGILVPPEDSQALAEGILSLLEDQTGAKEMGETARQNVVSRFSVGRMIDDYKEIYAGLIRKPQPVTVQR